MAFGAICITGPLARVVAPGVVGDFLRLIA
jgi:hypothetical protein